MKKVFLCLLILNTDCLWSQSLRWVDGVVVLKTETVLNGRVSFDVRHDVILFEGNRDHSRSVYPAYQVSSLHYYDDRESINRRFISICDSTAPRPYPSFYEIVLQGEVTLLRKQHLRAFRTTDPIDYDYYTWFDEELIPIHKFRRQVYPDLRASAAAQLDNFILESGAFANNDINAIRIIEYYNDLSKPVGVMAKQ